MRDFQPMRLGGYTRRSVLLGSLFGMSGIAQRLSQLTPPRQATIRLLGEINFQTVGQLIAQTDSMMKSGIDELILNISSPGGQVDPSLAAFQYMKGRRVPLTVHNFGSVESAAVMLFAAGTKRYSTSYARFLIHPPVLQIQGQSFSIHERDAGELAATLKLHTDSMDLGGHPNPASWGHPKSGQSETPGGARRRSGSTGAPVLNVPLVTLRITRAIGKEMGRYQAAKLRGSTRSL